MPRWSSIKAQLLFWYGIAFALLIGISGFFVVSLIRVDGLALSLDHKSISGTRILGEMADLLSETRLDEARLALATGNEEIAEARKSAEEHVGAFAEERAA